MDALQTLLLHAKRVVWDPWHVVETEMCGMARKEEEVEFVANVVKIALRRKEVQDSPLLT